MKFDHYRLQNDIMVMQSQVLLILVLLYLNSQADSCYVNLKYIILSVWFVYV